MKKILFVTLLLIITAFSFSASAESYLPRQEFIQMINSCLDISSDSRAYISDVPVSSTYFEDIRAAIDYGYIKGDENGKINPRDFLTRAEAATMLGRIMGTYPCDNTGFNDDENIYDWAKPSVKSLTDLKIITGHDDYTYRSDDFLTREQGEIIMSRMKANLFGGGDGSENYPYVISSLFHLRNISLNPDKYFILGNDLNLLNADYIFYPIEIFSGTFDAGGYKIIGLNSSGNVKSVFRQIDKNGKVINLKLSIPENYFSIADVNYGTIENCANISGTKAVTVKLDCEYAGNILNTNYGTVKNCYNASTISYDYGAVSGICGTNRGQIQNCFNTGNSSERGATGICALNYGSLENCFSTGYLSGEGSRAITSKNQKGNVKNCYYTSKMISSGEEKITSEALVSIFSDFDEFQLTEDYNFPTLKSNLYCSNENYTDFGGGDGSRSNPYIISEQEHFLNVKKYPGSHFIQTKDISLTGITSFEPAGSNNVPFTGSYNGDGYKITNLILYSPSGDNLSIFGVNSGTIKNVHILNSIIYGNLNVASLAVENSGVISNCSSDTYIDCVSGAGLVMNNSGEISECAFYGNVRGKQTSSAFVYANFGVIENCLLEGSVKAANSGGITYINNGNIISSCCFGEISGNKTGLLSYENNGEITKSYYLGNSNATVITIRNIEAFPRTEVQAKYQSSFELLDFDIWSLTDSFPQLAKNLKPDSPAENTTDFAGGTGEFSNPFKIVTPRHFVNISKYPSKSFILLNDIDLGNMSREKSFKTIEFFSGYLNGNSHTLTNLNQKGISSLFGTNYGIITNLTLNNFTLYGETIAPVALTNNGIITLCRNNSDISGNVVSGIAAVNNSVVERCINNGNLTGSFAAGISVSNTGEITDCLISGSVSGNDVNSKILGVSSGGSILSSIVMGDLYFKDGIGEFYPVADTAYSYCYYLDRYNRKENGNVTFSQLISKKNLYGINFTDIWVNDGGEFPYLSELSNENLKTPETFTSGDGSKENPYVVLTLNDLYNIRMYPESHFTVLSDIVAGNLNTSGILNNGGKGFTPIENFSGTLEGNNSIIYGIEILYSDLENAGLFTQNYGIVKDLGFSGVRVEGKNSAGAVCGINYSSVSNIKILNSRIGAAEGDAGSVCGINYGSVSYCTNFSDVFAAANGGGIAGVNHKNISSSTNWGGVITVSDEDKSYAGGIAGTNLMTIETCVNNGKIFSYSDKNSAYVGGIAGFLNGSVKNSYNTGEHTAKSPSIALAGGIAGGGDKMKISGVYNIGYGLTSSATSYVGSIAGSGTGNISNAYYDHTLTTTCSGENISELSVFAISPDDFSNLENLTAFSESIWTIPKSSTYYYPQLRDNLHISKTYADNVRDFGGGDGSITNPYRILTAEHLNNVRKYLGSSFALMGNIDMRKYCRENSFAPIGDNIFGFFGTFMGNGYEIIGLETNVSNYGGLFRQNHGEIYNLTISDGKFTGDTAGAICALNTGLLYGCSSSSEINNTGSRHLSTGGIAGINKSSGMIVSCSNTEDISGSAQSAVTGGITSANYGIIAGCINYGSVSANAHSLSVAGGISGYNFGTISDSANILPITSTTPSVGETIAGGLSGTNAGNLVNCYSASESVSGKIYGGVTANNNGIVINCYYNNAVDIPCSLGNCEATAAEKFALTDKNTFEGFDFSEMWYASGSHFPVPIETLY